MVGLVKVIRLSNVNKPFTRSSEFPVTEVIMTSNSTVVTESGGRQNLFANEPAIYVDPKAPKDHAKSAELINGRWAMVGFVSAIISYALTGDIIPGIF